MNQQVEKRPLIGCPLCRGTKEMMGLGMLVKKCSRCSGVGFIEKPLDVDTFLTQSVSSANTDIEKDVVVPVKKKRKPRSKVAND